ncbi:MAG: hypothetical protein ACYS1A_16005 [Planctomycetota bacterium]|jgi:hypothetical protein
MSTTLTPVGFDLGNSRTKIKLLGKVAWVPSSYAFVKPAGQISQKTGQELKSVSFPLLFQGDMVLWFGRDVLGAGNIQKLDIAKYDPDHLAVLFRAALYQWGKTHRIDLSTLGKLNIVGSMPPGLFQQSAKNKIALSAYKKAFNRGQSHLQIRDGQDAAQVVTQFGGMVREAVAWGEALPRQGELLLTVDLGGGTNDYCLFNGSPQPLKTWTDNAGLLHAFSQIDPINPGQAELKLLRNKKAGLPHQLITFFNEVERRIQMIILRLPRPVDRIYIIGGGATLMTSRIKATFTPLAPKVFIKNEYANADANWRKAGGV